jgi:polysaccharide biosynthesis protein PslH
MRILVFYPYIPYPIDRGTYQRTFHLLRELARDHEVDLLALSEGGERLEHREVFTQFCRRVQFVPFEHPAWPKLSERLLHGKPTTVRHWELPHVATALDSMINTGKYDLVHVCDIVLAQFFLNKYRHIPLSVDRSRVDLQFQQQQHATMVRGLKDRILNYENIVKLAAFEKRIAARTDLQVVCGPDDATFIRKEISKEVPLCVVGNGVDLTYFRPDAAPDARADQPTILFCGAMDYTPNVDALRWFFLGGIHEYLLDKIPNLKTLIVGKAPLDEVKAYSSRVGVTVTGGVPDVRPYYRQAWLQIVPLRIGGGTRLKIVESLAIGTPVVSTTIGAQGLDLNHNHEILLADTAESFAQETVRLLENPALRTRIEENGQRVANERFGWPALGRQLSERYESFAAASTLQPNRIAV